MLLSYLLAYYLWLSFVSSQATVKLFPPSGTVSVCQGEVQTITCTVTGSQVLGWSYRGKTTSFSNGSTTPQYISPFKFALLYLNNDKVTSIAVGNVSTSINGSTIECRTLPVTGLSISQLINFIVKNSVPISYLHFDVVSSDTLLISWTGADCIQSYDVFINGTIVNTTSGMSLLYNTGGAIGSIDVLVNSVDYYGRTVGNLSNQYQFKRQDFKVEAIVRNNTSMSIIINLKDTYIYQYQQPAPLSCKLTVTSLTQSSMDCLYEKEFLFTDITEGDQYNYTVTITNVIGSTVKNGSIEIPYSPVVVCSSKAPNSPSTMIPISSASTPTSTVSSSSCNCVLPWTVGAIIVAVAVAVIVILLVIIICILIHNKKKTKDN